MLHQRSAVLLLALLLGFGPSACLSEQEKADRELEATVRTTLENTPERVAVEVLATCDKWMRLDTSCIEEEAHRDQFECWLERGYPKLEHGYKYKLRPRTRDSTTLMKLDHCMELRKWRLVVGRKKRYEHIMGQR